jgi:hypothetical protein
LTQLADSKGYKLISNVGCNAIFVRKEYYSLFHKRQLTENDLFTYEAFSDSQLGFAQKFHKYLFAIFRPRLAQRCLSAIKRKVKLFR